MNEILFTFLSFSPGPFWLMLAFVPMHKRAMQAFDIYLVLLSTIFAILTIPLIPELLVGVASPKLSFFQHFLSSERGTVGSWNHMILGDLWIGRWVTHDSIHNNVTWFIRLPILLVILFFGPVGLFFYMIYRILFLKKIWLTADNK
jgi:hypothetical protein